MLELRDGRRCHSKAVEGVSVGLAFVDAVIAFFALYKLIRIHSRNTLLGWTRQKVVHLLIGSSNLGYFLYFVLNVVAACKGWICWSYSCGFVIMAFPRILFIAAFLLLLSFWVDLCHQSNDDEEDEYNPQEVLLDKMNKTNAHANGHRRCCTFRLARIGSRQKIVILVTILVIAIMVASSVLIWIGMGNGPIQPAVVAQAYICRSYCCGYPFAWRRLGMLRSRILFMKMKKVKSEQASSEMWKVALLAVVSVTSFTSSASIAIGAHVPLFYDWDEQRRMDGVLPSLLIFAYYFIGSSVPSAVVLFLMRELPPPPVSKYRREESTTITFIHEDSVAATQRQYWTRVASMQNQVSRASPI